MELDILIAHPLKHHVFSMAVGCQNAGLNIKLITPLYKKSWLSLVVALPGPVGKKINGYYYKKLNTNNVITPIYWQLRRLFKKEDIVVFQEQFDSYVAQKINNLKIKPKVLLTMQDYMPLTVQAAKKNGVLIWSDQILNRSIAARENIRTNLLSVGHHYQDNYGEEQNNMILSNSNIVTAPSQYTLGGVSDRITDNCNVYIAPYGVDESKFSVSSKSSRDTVRIIARANNIRKGGHLLLDAIQDIAVELLKLTKGKSIEFNIIGTLDDVVSKKIVNLKLPNNITVNSKVIPSIDMPLEFANSHLFIMPSLSEGMSLMCIEAMQMKLPLIITNECGIDCFVDETMGIKIETNVDSISKGLINAFSNIEQWENWGIECKNQAQLLTWSSYEQKICEIAQSINLKR